MKPVCDLTDNCNIKQTMLIWGVRLDITDCNERVLPGTAASLGWGYRCPEVTSRKSNRWFLNWSSANTFPTRQHILRCLIFLLGWIQSHTVWGHSPCPSSVDIKIKKRVHCEPGPELFLTSQLCPLTVDSSDKGEVFWYNDLSSFYKAAQEGSATPSRSCSGTSFIVRQVCCSGPL